MSDSPVKDILWDGKKATIEVVGDIDLYRSKLFQEKILAVVSDNPEEIVVDLSGVPYMDSSGVASLVKLLSRTRSTGIGLTLANPSMKVRSILEITSLDSVFNIEDKVDD